jgi:hypothetical protein
MSVQTANPATPAATGFPPALRLRNYAQHRLGALRHIFFIVLLFNVIFNLPFWLLHRHKLMLPEFNLEAPYHYDPRYAERRYHLDRLPSVDLIVTGDSRVEGGINPALIERLSCFNFAIGAQTIPHTEHILLDTLAKLKKEPRFLLIAITPDYLSTKGVQDHYTEQNIQHYRAAEEFHRHGRVARKVLEHAAPSVFYRETVLRDLKRLQPLLTQATPPREIWGFHLQTELAWSEFLALYQVPMTARGFNVDLLGVHVHGVYRPSEGVRLRLQSPYRPDEKALTALVKKLRDRRIEPLFTIMPFHESFYAREFHPGVLEPMSTAVSEVSHQADVLHLKVPFDTHDASNYFDGHHMSALGAERFSKALNIELQKVSRSGELEQQYRHRFGSDGVTRLEKQ